MTKKICYFLLLAVLFVVCSSWAQSVVRQDDGSEPLMKSASEFDRALGFLDAGKM